MDFAVTRGVVTHVGQGWRPMLRFSTFPARFFQLKRRNSREARLSTDFSPKRSLLPARGTGRGSLYLSLSMSASTSSLPISYLAWTPTWSASAPPTFSITSVRPPGELATEAFTSGLRLRDGSLGDAVRFRPFLLARILYPRTDANPPTPISRIPGTPSPKKSDAQSGFLLEGFGI